MVPLACAPSIEAGQAYIKAGRVILKIISMSLGVVNLFRTIESKH